MTAILIILVVLAVAFFGVGKFKGIAASKAAITDFIHSKKL